MQAKNNKGRSITTYKILSSFLIAAPTMNQVASPVVNALPNNRQEANAWITALVFFKNLFVNACDLCIYFAGDNNFRQPDNRNNNIQHNEVNNRNIVNNDGGNIRGGEVNNEGNEAGENRANNAQNYDENDEGGNIQGDDENHPVECEFFLLNERGEECCRIVASNSDYAPYVSKALSYALLRSKFIDSFKGIKSSVNIDDNRIFNEIIDQGTIIKNEARKIFDDIFKIQDIEDKGVKWISKKEKKFFENIKIDLLKVMKVEHPTVEQEDHLNRIVFCIDRLCYLLERFCELRDKLNGKDIDEDAVIEEQYSIYAAVYVKILDSLSTFSEHLGVDIWHCCLKICKNSEDNALGDIKTNKFRRKLFNICEYYKYIDNFSFRKRGIFLLNNKGVECCKIVDSTSNYSPYISKALSYALLSSELKDSFYGIRHFGYNELQLDEIREQGQLVRERVEKIFDGIFNKKKDILLSKDYLKIFEEVKTLHVEQEDLLNRIIFCIDRLWFLIGELCGLRNKLGEKDIDEDAEIEKQYSIYAAVYAKIFFQLFELSEPLGAGVWDNCFKICMNRQKEALGAVNTSKLCKKLHYMIRYRWRIVNAYLDKYDDKGVDLPNKKEVENNDLRAVPLHIYKFGYQ